MRGASSSGRPLQPGPMGRVVLTTCCAEKRRNAEPLSAVRRYTHPRLRVAEALARDQGVPLMILSGVFGLVDARTPLPWYDHALRPSEALGLSGSVAGRLNSRGVTAVMFVCEPLATPGWAPYHDAVIRACEQADVTLTRHEVAMSFR
jgi:hypothetical protein